MSEEETPSMPRFLQRLKLIVETTPEDIASWSEDGETYDIHSDKFDLVLQKHFVNGNVNSFKRQLAYYGFNRKTLSGHKWSFGHPKFRKEDLKKMAEIKRSTHRMDAFATIGALKNFSTQLSEVRDKLNWLLTILGYTDEVISTRRYRPTGRPNDEEPTLNPVSMPVHVPTDTATKEVEKDIRPPKKRNFATQIHDTSHEGVEDFYAKEDKKLAIKKTRL